MPCMPFRAHVSLVVAFFCGIGFICLCVSNVSLFLPKPCSTSCSVACAAFVAAFEAISQTPLEPFPVYDVCNLAFVARCCKSLFCRKINDGPDGFAFLSISFDRRVHLLPVGFPVGTVACCGASPQTHTNMDEPESSSLQGSSEQSFSFSIYLCVALFAFEFPDISRPEFIFTFEFESGGSLPREATWGGQSRGIPDYVMGVGTWRRLRMWKQADTVY